MPDKLVNHGYIKKYYKLRKYLLDFTSKIAYICIKT